MQTEPNDVDHVYGELRRMAASFMRRERPGHTLQATALANEAYLSVGAEQEQWDNTGHYFGAAARAMRRVLIQHARARRAHKRGGEAKRVTLDDVQIPARSAGTEFADLNEAVEALTKHDASLGQLVKMRYFEQCTLEEIAISRGRSLASVKRDWSYARAWLHQFLFG